MGRSGFAAADNLTHVGAHVIALDDSDDDPRPEQATLLGILGADVRLGPGATASLPDDADVLVLSSGWRDDTPLLTQALARGIPVWSEAELAWRLRGEDAAPWLALTGAGGRATTVRLLAAMLDMAGLDTVAAGYSGTPLVEAVMTDHGGAGDPYDVLAVALSAAQLRWSPSVRAESAAVLSVGDENATALGRIYEGVERACVYNVADPATEQLVRDADVVEGARAIGVTLGTPAVGMLGVVDDVLCDRAFVEDRQTSAAELCTVGELLSPDPAYVAQALTAAALARAHGLPPLVVRTTLREFSPE
jgi:UDP-N-acetylmuramoylalanine--D-glutamate ligase